MRLTPWPDRHARATRRHATHPHPTRRRRPRPSVLEALEVRVMPAVLNISAHALTYAAAAGVANDLTVSTTGATGTYTFNDTGELITLGPGAVAAGWTGGGTHTVTGPDPSVTSIAVDTKNGGDTVNLLSVDAPTTVAFTNSAADLDTVILGNPTKGVQAILGNVTISNAAGKTKLTVDDSGNTPSSARNPTVAFGAVTNLAPRPIFFGAANVSALTVLGGGLFGTLTVNAGKAGPVTATPGANYGSGVLNLGSGAPLTYANFAAVTVTNAADQSLTPLFPPGGAITTTAGDLPLSGKSASYRVASFTDADANARTANFVASIHWGDGTPDSPGALSANGTGQFDVNAAHTYAAAGKYSVVVTITDTGTTAVPQTVAGIPVTVSDTGGSTATVGVSPPVTVTVLDAALRLTVTNVTATEGVPVNSIVGSIVIANLTADNPFAQASDFTAVIAWGDGTISLGVVQQTDGLGSPLVVTTAAGDPHAYREDSTGPFTGFRPYTLSVTVNDTKGGGSATARGTATVSDAPLNPGPVPVARFTEGLMSGNQMVAQFSDDNPLATAADFNAPFPPVISWGGGSTSIGTVVPDPAVPHLFDVLGAHVYPEETAGGPPTAISVAVTDEGGAKLTALGTAVIDDAAIAATAVPVPTNPAVPVIEGKAYTGDVALFTDANPKGVPGNFTAAIDWGDGTPVTDGTIRQDATGVFHVSGSHTYLAAGTYTIAVAVHDIGGSEAVTVGIVARVSPDLVSDGSTPAAHTDASLVNPWGIAFDGSGPLWVADNKSGRATMYDGAGTPQPLAVIIQGTSAYGLSTPTGVAANDTSGFVVPGGPSHFLFDTQDGTIAGWNNGSMATLVVNNSAAGAVYTGLALADDGGSPVLYAANFRAGVVEMYGSNFAPLGSFTDPSVPGGFAPSNVQAIGGQLYVAFARQDATRHDAVAGPGDGFVDVFSTAGVLLRRLVSNGPLDAPWGLALAPAGFGPFGNDLLVANHGDGTIDAFDPNTGQLLGAVADHTGKPVTVDGLRGLSFGNGGAAGPAGTLFFTAGPGGGAHGLLGSLSVAPNRVNVVDAALRLTVTNVTATEGVPLNTVVSSIVVANFTDDNALAQASDFSAVIDWGDGTTSPGAVQQTDGPGSAFFITTRPGDTHAYREDSTGSFTNFRPYTLTVTLTETKGGGSATARGTATVNDARLLPGPVPVATFTEGVTSGDQVVAKFSDENPNATAADFNGPFPPIITWGGGSTSVGTVVADPAVPHLFDVLGAHVYPEETAGGPPTAISVAVTDEGGAKLTALGTAVIGDALLAIQGLNIPTNRAVPIIEGKAYSGDVAVFTDANPKGVPGNFTAAIDWGDGTPVTDGTIRQDATGLFHVSGSHTYLEQGGYPITVAVHDIGGAFVSDPQIATVIEAALTSTAVNVPAAVEGAPFTARVATFNDANPNALLAEFGATILWGDGTASPGVITQPGGLGSPFFVTGTHAYAEETVAGRPNVLTVAIADEGAVGSVANPTAAVADAPLAATVTPPDDLLEGVANGVAVGAFVDADPGGSIAKDGYTATIDWGDGKTTDGTVAAGAGGVFNVNGTHTYATDGTYAVKLTVNDKGGMKAVATGKFVVDDPDLVPDAQPPIKAKEGQTFTNEIVASFLDPDNPLASAKEFIASIDWGDKTPITDGTVHQVAQLVDVFNVTGTHKYAKEGKYETTIVIKDPAKDKVELTIDPEVDVSDAPLTPTAATFFATEQVPFTAKVATFVDGDPAPDPSEVSAMIDWGDGTSPTSGSVSPDGTSPNGVTYVVSGGHTYNDKVTQSHQVTVTIVDQDGSQTVALSKAVIAATVGPGDAQGATFTALEGIQRLFGDVATFTEPDASVMPGDFGIAIDWGDGSPVDQTTGKVTAQGTGTGRAFVVSGSHLYGEPGTYSVRVTITDKSGHAAIAEGQAVVADGLMTVLPPPAPNIPATEGKFLTNVAVATYTESNPAAPVSDFKATIDWGDGSPNSDGVVTQPGGVNTPFLVSGDHTYAEARATPYVIKVTILDFDTVTHGVTTQATASTQATVTDAALTSPSWRSVTATEGKATTGAVVATFIDPNPLATAGDFTATIDWGDQTATDTGVITLAGAPAPGNTGVLVQVSGAHTYAQDGTYPVKVTLTDVDSPSAPLTASGTANVADAPLASVGAPISAYEGEPLSGVPVAVFTDANPNSTAADFPKVTIVWGDGTTSPGTVAPNGAAPNGVTFVVLGSHTYNDDETSSREVESAQVVTTIQDKDGSVTVATSRAEEQDPVLTDPGVDVRAVEGTPFKGTVSTFTYSNPYATPREFTATITWGDGRSSAGVIVADAPGRFHVVGSHSYARPGVYALGVSVSDHEGQTVSDTSTATVADAPLTASPLSVSVAPNRSFHGAVASFLDADPGASASDLSASIAWGDGTVTVGKVVPAGPARFTVVGTHTYARRGSFRPVVSIADTGGSRAKVTSLFNVVTPASRPTNPPAATRS